MELSARAPLEPSPLPAAADEGRKGARYWFFTANELGMEDVAAQIDHLHIVKCAELRTAGAGFVAGPLAHGFRRQAAARGAMRRSASGCARRARSAIERAGAERCARGALSVRTLQVLNNLQVDQMLFLLLMSTWQLKART